MTRIAFAVWNQRIAPVFDVARRVRVVEVEDGKILDDREEALAEDPPARKALDLAQLGVRVLVCGAISRPLHLLINAADIRVIAFVAGESSEVVRAFLEGRLDPDAWAMPGCRAGGRRCRLEDREYFVQEAAMRGNPGGGGQGGGRGAGTGQGSGPGNRGGGRGRGGRGQGQGGGRGGAGVGAGSGASGFCRCLSCGHQEPHRRGLPCAQIPCPKCGAAMTRVF
ncbi:MAG: hypothetical protein KA419_06465 [Acidobacteria bacterium]|nr:hypothetical protein [Acidobacteriota bacterium]